MGRMRVVVVAKLVMGVRPCIARRHPRVKPFGQGGRTKLYRAVRARLRVGRAGGVPEGLAGLPKGHPPGDELGAGPGGRAPGVGQALQIPGRGY